MEVNHRNFTRSEAEAFKRESVNAGLFDSFLLLFWLIFYPRKFRFFTIFLAIGKSWKDALKSAKR